MLCIFASETSPTVEEGNIDQKYRTMEFKVIINFWAEKLPEGVTVVETHYGTLQAVGFLDTNDPQTAPMVQANEIRIVYQVQHEHYDFWAWEIWIMPVPVLIVESEGFFP